MSRVPRIRFKGFEEDWEQRKLGEMVEFYNGDRSSRYPNDSDMVFDGIPFINAGDLVLGRVKLDTTNKITEEKYNQLSGAKIQCGDIIYCLRGTLGKNAFVDNFDIGTIASSLVDIRPQKIVGKYLFQVLNSDIEYSQRILNDEGAAQPNLSAKNLYLFDIPIPRDAEQIKIAEYLELLDHLITLHQSKSFGHILKVIISCTLSWEQRKLGEIGSVAMCRRVFKYQTTESGDIPFFKIGSFGATPDAFIPKDLFEKLKMKYPYPEKGDVLISASGSIGRTVVFTGKDEYFQDSNIVWLKHDNSIINHFLKYLYSIVKWVGIEGTTIKRLYNDNILKTEVIIPTLSEQQKVSNYLDGLDHIITLHQLEPFQLIFKAIAYRIIDYTKSKPPSHRK